MSSRDTQQSEDRRRKLLQFLADATVAGAKVESQSAERAVIATKRWGGLGGRRRRIVRVDELGNVIVEDV